MSARLLPPVALGMMLWMLATLLESAMMGVIRHVANDIDPLQIVFLRCFFGLAFLGPWILRQITTTLTTARFPFHALRALLQIVAMMFWFASVPRLPLADVAAIGFLAPLFATIGAVPILRERVGWRRSAALAVGFVGMLVLVRPGLRSVDAGVLMMLGSSLSWGAALLVIKSLSRTVHIGTMTAWVTVLITPFALVPALFVWQWPTTETWLLMALVGISGTCSHLLIGKAFQLTDASAVMPLDFTRMIWTSIIGWYFFGQNPDLWSWVGGAIVFGAATYITWRETLVARQKALDA